MSEMPDEIWCVPNPCFSSEGTYRASRTSWEPNRKCTQYIRVPEWEAVIDLVRFLAATYTEIDEFVRTHVKGDAIGAYPVVQGTRNQLDLNAIGRQHYDPMNIRRAVEYMLSFPPPPEEK